MLHGKKSHWHFWKLFSVSLWFCLSAAPPGTCPNVEWLQPQSGFPAPSMHALSLHAAICWLGWIQVTKNGSRKRGTRAKGPLETCNYNGHDTHGAI